MMASAQTAGNNSEDANNQNYKQTADSQAMSLNKNNANR